MKFVSTGGEAPPASLAEALHRGIAPDGGLYMPERIPRWPAGAWDPRHDLSLGRRAAALLAPFVGDELSAMELEALSSEALDFPIPLVRLDDQTWILELFHGPTLAFKDVGARFLARFLASLSGRGSKGSSLRDEVTILVATSGDTGGAVAQAFHRLAGTRVVVLYPHGPRGRVTERQERQFATLGVNIRALAVEGTFDDCQRLVKEAFADPLLAELRLTSANSINLGRLLPQATYYAHAVAQLPPGTDPPLFVTPSGNFGNLAAGLIAARAGLPVHRFLAATNANDVVPEYLRSGTFRPRPSTPTLANAMDVGNPSNLTRIEHLFGHDLEAIRQAVHASSHHDEEIRSAIRQVYETSTREVAGTREVTGTILDPHTAVGYLALQRYRQEQTYEGPAILLATADPAKFSETVEPILGHPLPLPPQLAEAMQRPLLREHLPPTLDALRAALHQPNPAQG